jgi:hypothetical protein
VSVLLQSLDGAFTSLRTAAVTRTRTIPGFDETTFGDARTVTNFGELDALELANRLSLAWCVVPVFFQMRTERGEKPLARSRFYELQWIFATPSTSKTVEEGFVEYVEKWENSWGALEVLTFAHGALTLRADMTALLADTPFAILQSEDYEILGHTTVRRTVMEVEACVRQG